MLPHIQLKTFCHQLLASQSVTVCNRLPAPQLVSFCNRLSMQSYFQYPNQPVTSCHRLTILIILVLLAAREEVRKTYIVGFPFVRHASELVFSWFDNDTALRT